MTIDTKKRSRCTCCTPCCILAIVTVVILAGVSVGLVYHFTDGFQKTADETIQDIGQKIKESRITLDQFINDDPHRNVTGPDNANTWASPNFLLLPGLRLRVLNALTEEWHPFFEAAMSDWENGSPDVLTLTSVTVSPAFDCKAEDQVEGVMKVCNGNYGDNGWRGLSTCVMTDGTILSCLAQMNEFYLQESTDEWKQYTMCHELGHGFGLPHTDDKFWNRDLGNCMDYTNKPGGSMHPDVTNFEFLASVYGLEQEPEPELVQESEVQEQEHVAEKVLQWVNNIAGINSAGNSNTSSSVEGVNRQLRQQSTTNMVHQAGKRDDDSSIPTWVSKRIRLLHQQLTRQRRFLRRQQQQQFMVESSSTQRSRNGFLHGGETHQLELGQGYSMVVHMLHADVSVVT